MVQVSMFIVPPIPKTIQWFRVGEYRKVMVNVLELDVSNVAF